MYSAHKTSFLCLLILILLLPVFFIPSALVPLGVAKVVILSFGLVVIGVIFLVELLRQGGVSLPGSKVIWAAVLIPVVYLLSALASAVPSVALYGYTFEVGTVGFMLLMTILFILVTLLVSDRGRLLRVYGALLIAGALVLIFSLVKLFTKGSALNFGVFGDVTANPVGLWTDVASVFGLIAVLSVFALEMLPLKRLWQVVMYVVAVLATILLVIFDFSVAWYVTLAGALVALVYFVTIERTSVTARNGSWKFLRLLPAALLFVVALIFSINPSLGAKGPIGNVISGHFGLSTSDVRPSFSSTLTVTKPVLKAHGLLGSGPNTFGRDWLQYKPSAINGTAYWNISFPTGVGFLPTVPATTGLLGTLAWAIFLVMLLLIGFKALRGIGQSDERFAVVSTFVGTFFLWALVFFYAPAPTIIALAFIFSGLFVASAKFAGVLQSNMFVFRRSPALNFVSVLTIVVLGIGAFAFGLSAWQHVGAAVHYERALSLSNTNGSSADVIEQELNEALALAPADIYAGTLSELEFARAQGILNNPTTTPTATQAAFQAAFQKSIAAADQATKLDSGNYQNWTRLGSVYSALVPPPLSVIGAYESSLNAYKQAAALSPDNPEPDLLEARLEINNNNLTTAHTDIQNAITKKQDYVDAYFLLTQLDVQSGNLTEAVQAAKATAVLSPTDAGVFFEIGLLDYNAANYTEAAQALNQAIQIVPEYANARYFLGLSLDKLGDHTDAIGLFQELAKANPDNTDVASILTNLEAGKDAFYKAPVGKNHPEKRANPPIEGTATQE
jgi:tetratricopeptide (TPR) repeat protein